LRCYSILICPLLFFIFRLDQVATEFAGEFAAASDFVDLLNLTAEWAGYFLNKCPQGEKEIRIHVKPPCKPH